MPLREFLEHSYVVVLVRGKDASARNSYAYVALRSDRLAAFIRALHSDKLSVHEYGTILASDYGDPTAEVIEKMTRDYGFSHEKIIDLNPDMPSV